jgi:branched-chain amino acid transport system substrate-binding protein
MAGKVRNALVALVVAVSMLGFFSEARAEGTLKIGAVYLLSGAFSTYGEFARNGMELAADEINSAGGILGRKVEFTLEDSQGKPDVAIQAVRKLVYQDKVDLLMGIDSSGVARAVAPVIPELKTPLVITHAATPDVTGSLCNKYVFRIDVYIAQNTKAAALIAKDVKGKNWTTIGPDYAFGHQSWEYFSKYLKKLKPDVVLSDSPAFPKFKAEDFTPYINKVMAEKPDGVFISLWGGDLINFIRQANNLGFFKQNFKVLMSLGAATEVLSALGDQMPEGVWVGTRYWFAANDSPTNKKFVAAYKKRFGEYPSYNSEGAYAALYTYKKAIEKAGSFEKDKIIAALENLTVDTPAGEIMIRAQDHQAVVDGNWGVTKADPDYKIRILDPVRVFPGKEITPPPDETGCKMQ